MKRLIIFNPAARRASRAHGAVRAAAAEGGAEIRTTEGPGDAARLARRARAEGVGQVVVAGGDGTVNEVLNGIAPHRPGGAGPDSGGEGGVPTVGLLPLGTGNDVARNLGVPLDLPEAVAALEHGAERAVDVGRVSAEKNRYFLNSAIGGVGGLVERRLSPRLKGWLGPMSYRVAAVASFRRVPRHRVEVERGDGGDSFRGRAHSVVVANGPVAGAGIPVAPEARPDDGSLDVVVAEAGTALGIPGLLADVLRGRHLDRPDVHWFRADSVTLRSRPPMWVSVDGEVLGDEALEVDVVPRALAVLVPPAGD